MIVISILSYIPLLLLVLITLILSKWVGNYIFIVMETNYIEARPILNKFEKWLLAGNKNEDDAILYFQKMLLINCLAFIFSCAALRYQHLLPSFTSDLAILNWTQAINIAASFITTTDWQSYSGENTLSLFSQTITLPILMFIGAATGLCMAVTLSRAIAKQNDTDHKYNFYQDFIRCIIWILLPFSFITACFFISQGVVQSIIPYVEAHTITGEMQKIPLGLVASFEAIKLIGDNGGGYFGASSAHPFENPNALTNFMQMVFSLMIPGALAIYYGKITANPKHGWVILWSMLLVLIMGIIVNYQQETQSISQFYPYETLNITGGNMEGKEVRFDIMGSSMFAQVSSATSGSVNSIHGSYTPLATLAIVSNLILGDMFFGGCGNGFTVMLFNIILAVFLAGLMVGRTPSYLGKKISPIDIKYIIINQVIVQISIIVGVTFLILNNIDTATYDIGTQGISRALYNLTSTTLNNGSTFLSVRNNLLEYQHLLSITMLMGRCVLIVCAAIIANSFAKKSYHYSAYNSVRADRKFFILIIIIAAVNSAIAMFPLVTIGPVAEHLTIHH